MKTMFKTLPTFNCEHCDLTFQNKTTLKSHIRKIHSVKTLFFSCEDCEERFLNKRVLLSHKRSKHTDLKGNLLNVKVTTPHPIKDSKKRKVDTSSPKNQEKTPEEKTTGSEDFLNAKLKELTIDRNKWQASYHEAMKKFQVMERQNIRLRDENGRMIEYCNTLKVENRLNEEVIMGEKWMKENLIDNNTLKETEDMDVTIKCSKCDYVAKNVEYMEKHNKTHTCEHCDFKFKDEAEKQAHITESHPTVPNILAPSAPLLEDSDEMYTCEECDYQTTQFQQLLDHIELKHRVATVPLENTETDLFKCKDCNNKFPNYNSMMKHRKMKHPKNCKNFPKGTCRFEKEECYWVHPDTMEVTESVSTEGTSQLQNETPFRCHTCSDNFTSKNAMMKHKKAKHTNNISCRDYPNCRRSAEQCWYRHDSLEQPSSRSSGASPPGASPPGASSDQVFQEPVSTEYPPDQLNVMMEMMKALQQQMVSMNNEIVELKQK